MAKRGSRIRSDQAVVAFVASALALSMVTWAQEPPDARSSIVPPVQPEATHAAQPQPVTQAQVMAYPECKVDLEFPGTMSGIVSNALVRGLKISPDEVRTFLKGSSDRYTTGSELLKAAAARFNVGEDVLAARVQKYKHCNCKHPVDNPLHPSLHVDPGAHSGCTSDIMNAGTMADVVSNALYLELGVREDDAIAFLADSDEFEDSQDVFTRTAVKFKISEDILATAVQKFRHCNCNSAQGAGEVPIPYVDDGLPVSAFAKNVNLHVVLHELGHALIREFDIPILGNEETQAEAFATYYLTTYLPDRAVDVLCARVTSLMIEAGESHEVDWSGEHDHDGRRAFQIAALAVAADPVKYKPVAKIVGMTRHDIEDAVDYGAEIRRSWRRVLAPLSMPEGTRSTEADLDYEESNGFFHRLLADGLADELELAMKGFDWHSQVTIRFVNGDGGAGWNRSARAITVHSGYIQRFIQQGNRGLSLAQLQTPAKLE